jgi:hypothetical protein
MVRLLRLHKLRWYLRIPVKWMIFAITVAAVCFPYPHRLAQHVRHWRDPNALIEPDAAALQPLVEELRPLVSDELTAPGALRTVRDFVYERIEYAWDWETWGTADYLPTVTEAIEMGKEDCDGRAVVAASLLRNLGYESTIVTDLLHVWVKTDKGETMHPGTTKAVVATERGLRFRPDALAQIPRAFSYGVAVFPLGRELIVLGMLWLLLLRPRGGVGCSLAGLALLVCALLLLRAGSEDHRHPILWLQTSALLSLLTALLSLFVWAGRNARWRTRLPQSCAL